jgi:hypothetical protein
MTIRVLRQSISVPTLSGYGNIPDVGTAGHESDGCCMDAVAGGPYVDIARPHLAVSNSLVHGIFRDPIEIRIERLVARVRKDDFNALLELAYLSRGKDDPVRLRQSWRYELHKYGEIRTSPELVGTDLWQSTPARRALKRAVEEFVQRNHGNAERLRAIHEWEADLTFEELDASFLKELEEGANYVYLYMYVQLISAALTDYACVDDRALHAIDFLYATGCGSGLSKFYTDLLGAKESGFDLSDPSWWFRVEYGYLYPADALLDGIELFDIGEFKNRASSIGQIEYARFLEERLKNLRLNQEWQEREQEFNELEKRGFFRELIERMIEDPRECVAAMVPGGLEFVKAVVKRMAMSGHPKLSQAISSLADEAKNDRVATVVLTEFVFEGGEDAYRSFETLDVDTLHELLKTWPSAYLALRSVAERSTAEGRTLSSGSISEVLSSPEGRALEKRFLWPDAEDTDERLAEVIPFKPPTDPE